MGNVKSMSNKMQSTTDNRKQLQAHIVEPVKLPEIVNEQEKQWKMSERDIAFLCSQTGKSSLLILLCSVHISVGHYRFYFR